MVDKDQKQIESGTQTPEKIDLLQIAKAAQKTLYKPVSDSLDKYKPQQTDSTNQQQQQSNIGYDLLRDFLAIGVTQPAISYITLARNELNNKPHKNPQEVLKERYQHWSRNPVHNSFMSTNGFGVFQRRTTSFVAVNGAIDKALPPSSDSDTSTAYAEAFKRSAAKAGLETIVNVYSEASNLKDYYGSKQGVPSVIKSIAPGSLARNLTIMGGYEGAKLASKLQSYNPTEAAVAGGLFGLATGFAAGIIDNKITFKQVAEMAKSESLKSTETSVLKPNPRSALAAGLLRSVQAGLTTGALTLGYAIMNEIKKTMQEKDANGNTMQFSQKDFEAIKTAAFETTSGIKKNIQGMLGRVTDSDDRMHYQIKRTENGEAAQQQRKSFAESAAKPISTSHADKFVKSKMQEALERDTPPKDSGLGR
ncbi:MAG: hypothetical protein COV35_10430 [Alphaproteobacteria bacterium CG11_big_fil_rev_8_21_14_0_20_39_49]|nr:MAG: hypothetical protein COV35_10430 [Alphaproteobacteria bacterium CG11_big_fil_rev_8_21_14_0_20_39_49]